MVVTMSEMNDVEKFKNFLKELFRIDLQDLDFGIYKIMKIKQDMILKFVDEDLVPIVESTISGFPDQGQNLMADVFNLSYEFLSRYYSNGDFIPQIRYGGRNKYMIPYNGQEVELYWATRNSYYVKTTEYFTNYSFIASDPLNPNVKYKINFKIKEADLDKNYVVSEKKYFFIDDNPISIHDKEIDIFFNYRPIKEDENEIFQGNENFIKDSIKQKAEKIILSKVPDQLREVLSRKSTESEIDRTIIRKHINIYLKKNETDYFIVKNLRAFLNSELDNFIKNEILFFDTEYKLPERNRYLSKAISKLCKQIIEQISQIEDFERRLWEKKKFSYNVNYVITLDRIADKYGVLGLINKIIKDDGIEKQIQEWKELGLVGNNFSIHSIFNKNTAMGLGELLNQDFKFLPIDTKYFKKLELDILGLFENLDNELDGWLIHSENYQALSTILPKFKEKIQTIYIDPPFNTGKDFLFKDNYQDSSWLTLIANRLELGKKFMKNDSSLYLHLDHIAEHYGRILLDQIFGVNNFRAKITWNTGENISGFKSQAKNWIRQADFIHFYTKSEEYKFIKIFEENKSADKTMRENNKHGWLDILGYDKDNLFIEVWVNGDLVKENISENVKPKGTIWNDIYSFQYSEPRITESIGFISNQKPENLLRRIIQSSSEKGDIIMDFFVGSGTTAAVAHKLKRKWLGVDVGNFFYETYIDTIEVKNSQLPMINEESIMNTISKKKDSTVIAVKKLGLMGRMKIVLSGDSEFYAIHSKQKRTPHLTKDLKWQGGGFFKYFDLEQYEDSLNNIKIREEQNYDKLEPYLIEYILKYGVSESEIFINKEMLSDPFNVKMKIVQEGIEQEVAINLIETFNLWYGLNVEKILSVDNKDRRYIFEIGKKDKQRVIVIWRDTKNLDYIAEKDFIGEVLKKNFNFDDNSEYYTQVLINNDSTSDFSVDNIQVRSLDPIFFDLQWGDPGAR
jgi:adenine-specific DNA-methyltransferase